MRLGISIHALLAESDWERITTTSKNRYFYPRSPCGERRMGRWCPYSKGHFYPRSPCGERQGAAGCLADHTHFYPRSPCGERRLRHPASRWRIYFYPRSPCGERLATLHNILKLLTISIHALLAESDNCTSIGRPKRLYFYPRSPCGERPSGQLAKDVEYYISIHALLAESDVHRSATARATATFLSTLSLRRATYALFG